MAEDIVTRLGQDNDFAVFTAGDGMPGLRVMSEADRRQEAADEIQRLRAEAQAMRRFIQETAIVNGITVDDSEHRFWRLSDGTYMPQSVIDLVWNSEARRG